jgi:hypothetical protein
MSKPVTAISERRANTARLSPLLLALFALFACTANVTAAHAEPPKELKLSETNPRSSAAEPINLTTPRVRGSDEEIGKSVVRFGFTRPISAASSPTNIVNIFTDPGCEATPVATGTYKELNGEGIQVEVAPNSETTFYANQADTGEPGNPSPCTEKGVIYYESSSGASPPSEPPPAGGGSPPVDERPAAAGSTNAPTPPRLRTVPGGRANDNAPSVFGSAPGASQVKIFNNSGCTGPPIASVSPAGLSAGVVAHVPDNSVTDFAAISSANGKQSFCSTPATYIEDSTPPHVRITMGPGVKTRRHKAVFRFATADEEPTGTSFRCRVNHGKWKACHSPFKLKHLHFRRYVLSVSATDEVGNTEARPARRSFKVIH